MPPLWATSNVLSDADSCLVENLADLVFVFPLFFKRVKKFGMWIFLWLMKSLYLFGQCNLFWIQCTSLFHNHRNKGAYLQWSVALLLLLQYYKAVCYNLSLGHMGFPCSPKSNVLGVGDCCKVFSSFQLVHDGGTTHMIQDLNK